MKKNLSTITARNKARVGGQLTWGFSAPNPPPPNVNENEILLFWRGALGPWANPTSPKWMSAYHEVSCISSRVNPWHMRMVLIYPKTNHENCSTYTCNHVWNYSENCLSRLSKLKYIKICKYVFGRGKLHPNDASSRSLCLDHLTLIDVNSFDLLNFQPLNNMECP